MQIIESSDFVGDAVSIIASSLSANGDATQRISLELHRHERRSRHDNDQAQEPRHQPPPRQRLPRLMPLPLQQLAVRSPQRLRLRLRLAGRLSSSLRATPRIAGNPGKRVRQFGHSGVCSWSRHDVQMVCPQGVSVTSRSPGSHGSARQIEQRGTPPISVAMESRRISAAETSSSTADSVRSGKG